MKDNKNKTIFIYIAACKEQHLITTIKSALANAKYKDRIYFGIFNMVIDEFDRVTDPIINNDNINYVEVKAQAPMGIGYGRLNSSLLSDRDHDFALQVDAQTIFDKNWDELIIEKFLFFKKDHEKSVISITPNRAIYVNDKYYFGPNFENNGGIEIDPFNFDSKLLDEEDGKPLNNSVPWAIKNNKFSNGSPDPRKFFIDGVGPIYKNGLDYIEIPGVDASWMFSDYSMIRNFLHDPHNVFSGDQTNYSLRLISNGYKIFCVKKPLILNVDKWLCGELYHKEDWRKNINENPSRLSKWWDSLSKKYENDIFSGEYLGYWGAPDLKSLQHAKIKMEFED